MDHTLIIGLGNPDPTLEETYHNVGALAVQWIAEHAEDGAHETPGGTGSGGAAKFRAHKNSFTYAKIGTYIFIRPLVFMNESGRAVKDAMRTFDAKTKDIVVIHDDSDIPLGDFKRARGGGSAGHNGIQSIIDHLHTEDFARIRIGIREPNEAHRKKAGDFVLSPITHADKKVFDEVFQKISATLEA
ncbi:MAG TPA: aminoacyl-tRNA hydrolase [Candidatus Paceibacterota bacterium]|nr:aminoacyl-tRNA hydrolase [Candidatus Paceibacterota bacterium]